MRFRALPRPIAPVPLLALLGLLSLAAPAAARGPAPKVPLNTHFGQRDWLAPDGTMLIECSRVGFVTVEPTRKAQQLLQPQGEFVNVVTTVPGGTPQWSVRNLHLWFPDQADMLASAPTVDFDIGVANGTCLSRLDAIVTLTPAALNGPPLTEAASSERVTHPDYLVGGRDQGGANQGGSAASTIPFTIGPWDGPIPSLATVVLRARADINDADVAVINEDPNGCAPASCARSIDYLFGGDAGDPQDIYDELYDAMNTDPDDGTTDADMLAGKNAVAAAHGLAITSTLVYGTPDDVAGDLDDGCDIEALISWDGGGGHAAFVKKITCFADGSCQVTYVDDPDQDDGDPGNEEHVIDVDSAGDFDGGHLDGFLVECPT